MTAMFPDSGVPYTDARNSLANPSVVNCNPLWYSTSRCKPRFDPAAANAELSELINLINKGEVAYDCNSFNNVELAARYLVQRGLPRAAYLYGGPQNYTAGLDPRLTRYNDYLTLTVVPGVTNIAIDTVNIDGVGGVYILRNDGNHLEPGDLVVGKPAIITYWQGAFYLVGLAASQVPIVKKGGIDAWIRTDGNDTTGDGTANTPDKAFKTIAGCWYAVGSRYAASPSFSINMKLGIPGTYDGAILGPFGGQVSLTGDVDNRTAYKIGTIWTQPSIGNGQGYGVTLAVNGMASFTVRGVTFNVDKNPSVANWGLGILNSSVTVHNCDFDLLTDAQQTILVFIDSGGEYYGVAGIININGNGHKLGNLFRVANHSSCIMARLIDVQTLYYNISNLECMQPIILGIGLSVSNWGGPTAVTASNVVGVQYAIMENSILNMGGKPLIGTLPGSASSGAQFIP